MATVNQQIDKRLFDALKKRAATHQMTLIHDARAGVFEFRHGKGAATRIVDLFDTVAEASAWLTKQEDGIRKGKPPKWENAKTNPARKTAGKRVKLVSANPLEPGIGKKAAREKHVFDYLIQEWGQFGGVWLTIGGADSPERATRFAQAEHAARPSSKIRVMDQRGGK